MTGSFIEQMKGLRDDLARNGADVESRLTVFPSGGAMLDVRRNGRAFVMAYSPAHGFGVDELHPDQGLGNHYRFTSPDIESAARTLRALGDVSSTGAGPDLSLLVLQAKDIEKTKDFYSLLGLAFVAEQHGAGSRHYSATLGPLVLEIYPSRSEGAMTPVRVGFRISTIDQTLDLLRAYGVKLISELTDTPWGRRAVVEDPDGNRVELAAQA